MVAPAVRAAEIQGVRFGLVPNPLRGKSALDQTIEWINKTPGSEYRIFKTMDQVSKIASAALKEMNGANDKTAAFYDGVASKAGLAAAMLAIPTLPEKTKNAYNALFVGTPRDGLVVVEESATNRQVLQNVQDVAEATAYWGYTISLLYNKPEAKQVADMADLIVNTGDLVKQGQDIHLARKYLNSIPNDGAEVHQGLRTRFTDKIATLLMKQTKTIISVATGVLALLGIVLSSNLLLGLGLVGSVIAPIAAHFYMATREYKEVQFFKPAEGIDEAGQLAF